MFELAQSGDGPDVQEIVAKGREIGVDLEEFLNTLLGKWECLHRLTVNAAKRFYGKQTDGYKELKWKVTECMTCYLTQVYTNLQIDYHNAYKGTVIVSNSTVSYQKLQ